MPLEFRVLRYSPRPWSMQDSLAIAYQMVETLTVTPKAALTREEILAKIGPELTADLYVNTSWRDHPPTAPPAALDSVPPPKPASAPAGAVASMSPETSVSPLLQPWLEPFIRDRETRLGSNNWVVSGAHTVSGKPLLSNDMHLGHSIPDIWYEAHLACPELEVVYTRDAEEARRRVAGGEFQAAFLLPPPRVKQMRAIALAGERMPEKTTYFWPKAFAGLVIYGTRSTGD